MVEQEFSKLKTRVRSPSPAPFHRDSWMQSEFDGTLAQIGQDLENRRCAKSKKMSEITISTTPAMVTIEPIGPDHRATLANLLQFYLYDFSELYPDKPECELRSNGQFGEYPYLEKYFQERGRVALLLRNGEATIGFAMLNQVSNCGELIDFNMAEFFIARKYRRRGCGVAAAHAIFAAYRGEWELSVVRPNIAAQNFWSQAFDALPMLSPLRKITEPSPKWAITYRFRT